MNMKEAAEIAARERNPVLAAKIAELMRFIRRIKAWHHLGDREEPRHTSAGFARTMQAESARSATGSCATGAAMPTT